MSDLSHHDGLLDRIAELEDDIETLTGELQDTAYESLAHAERAEAAEAKLAKAVEHFKKLRRRQDCLETFDLVVHEATFIQMELTGKTND